MTAFVTDFSRSFVRWSIAADPTDTRTPGHMPWGNSVRLQIDARCSVTDADGSTTELLLIAPCRKEWMYRENGLIMDPGAEYRAIFSADRQVDVAMQARLVGDRPLPATASAFIDLAFEHSSVAAERLSSDQDIVDMSATTRPLVVQTTLGDERTGRSAVIEYPVKTMNYHPERGRFQVDTGPLIYPDFSGEVEHPIDSCRLAHAVFNTLDYAEFAGRPGGDDVDCLVEGVGLRRYRDLYRVAVVHQFFAVV